MKKIIFFTALLLLHTACTRYPEADEVIIGKIWTANEKQPWAEAMAIAGDTILAVGTRNEILKYRGKHTRLYETSSEHLIVPGFIDCHTHFVDGGFALASVQLRDAKTPREFIQRIADFARTQPKGTWITNGDWDHENWGGELPSRFWIDSVTSEHPVWINRLDGHMALANTAALKYSGITDKVKDVQGGTIVRDKSGRLTGIFKDNAMSLVRVPPPTPQQEDAALQAAMDFVASHGVTSVHNMSGYLETFERAHRQGLLKTRIYAGMMLSDWKLLADKIQQQGRGDAWLRIGTLKEFVDGSLGSHTAAFFKPYTDAPNDSGFFVIKEDELYKRIKSADSAGLQIMTHAIGDKAIHVLLNIYERVANENGHRDRRFRIEHAQHIHPADIPRFAKLQVIASMQPYHAIDDGRWAEKVIGYERCKTTYAFRSLLDAGATVAFGSDWFVAPPVPLYGIYAAVTRSTLDEKNPDGWVPEQKISVEEALKAYTIHAAYAAFEENLKGSLAAGKLADYVVLEKNIFEIPASEIRQVNVLRTVVGGKVVFEKAAY
ncbi:MAG: amidohydrolase [Cyclobacteriaceae bacterium]|nr:amidohydrolase [Cyclobacteriaceae bacterium]MDW8331145.1 amidohydrolase [Cyclobacteriaceae bacterium]